MRQQSVVSEGLPGGLGLQSSTTEEIANSFKEAQTFKNFFQQYPIQNLDDLLTKLTAPAGKKSFLVFKNNKYINIPTDKIAFFYIRHESTIIVTFDNQEYFVNHSLDQIQNLLFEK